VTRTSVGYTGGETDYPSYASVCAGDGHTEAIRIEWDPQQTDFSKILDVYQNKYTGGSFRFRQYRSAIWFHSPQQQAVAESFKSDFIGQKKGQLDIEPVATWWDAELYHQKYQKRMIMTLGLWAVMGSFWTVGSKVTYAAKTGLNALTRLVSS